MNATSMERDKELQSTKKKLAAMEKLNRALQDERASLLKEKNKGQNNGTETNGVN